MEHEPVTQPVPRILLVDCDAFYVQVARLEDPEGAGRARLLVVGGAGGRGVVTSASYEARAYGVRSAMPTAEALRLCPEATVVPVPRAACSARSREVRDALSRLSPVVQAASIDEFYLDLTGTERLFRGESLTETAERIRRTVLDETRISVSIGGGTRRLIAKLAASRAKPAGVYVVAPGEEEAFMRELRLADIPGIGPAFAEVLARRGLVHVRDALEVQPEWFERWFGPQRGRWLASRIRGEDASRVDPHEPRRSISSERTFFEDRDDDARLERTLARQAMAVAGTLRRQGLRARTVTVKLRDHDFRTRSASRTLPEPVETDQAVFEVARRLLGELRRRRRVPVRLLGVGLSGLQSEPGPHQLALFDEAEPLESDRDRTVTRVLDTLRERFGADAVVPGRVLGDAPRGGDVSSSSDGAASPPRDERRRSARRPPPGDAR
ncbi:MAG: DNA polymerase IV [Gemmatimonadetes bacterium]|nr:MAG: DNA polymerase IV [Gemmatimonadota bacterium]